MVHNINPEIVSFVLFGMEFSVRWYGLLYVISFIIAYFLYKPFLKKKDIEIDRDKYESLLFYIMIGVILGGRLGYILFYNLRFYMTCPLSIFAVWEGGMSFHGGAIGVFLAGWLFTRRHKLPFYRMADAAVPIVAIGLGLGRLGNFINGELWGNVTTLPWGIVFPDGGALPRHPTQ
ncbi:MAG TPA: prolipoprotein diacylglyceryl transferase, partial [Candidatus Cloacimonetes bacterium]|nr:prolipoprotein diacylglyceryl transferase [Candidatus Cloacimonadota bacterium]